jgi:1-acyl-sn-glycerol-3-phosphate acyltransferase
MESARNGHPSVREGGGLAHLRNCAAFYAVLGTFCVVALGWSLLAAILHRIMPRRAGRALGQFAVMHGCQAGLALMRATGQAHFDLSAVDQLRGQEPTVIACNHLSLLDAILLLSRLPNAVCIAKAPLWDNPFYGGCVRLANYLRNDAPLTLVKDGVEALRQGQHLIVFPEGTRSDGRGLGAFRPGFAAIARAAGAPVQTVLLGSDTPYLGPGWPPYRMPPLPLSYWARCGRRFILTGRTRDETARIEQYFAAELARG